MSPYHLQGDNDKSHGNYAIEVTELKNDEKGNVGPNQAKAGNVEWKKGDNSHVLPSGNMASTTKIHFPVENRDLPQANAGNTEWKKGEQFRVLP